MFFNRIVVHGYEWKDYRTKSTWTKRTAHRQKVFGQKVPGIGQKVPHFIKKTFFNHI